MDIKDFNADKAREILETIQTDELEKILLDIKSKAEEGESVLHIYTSLKSKTKEELVNRGFKVIDQPSIAMQRDGLYYSICWGDWTKNTKYNK